MRIAKPMSEEEIDLSNLLPAGCYDFTIKDATEKQSSKGNDMIVVNLQVFRPSGGFTFVTDYLLEAMAYKLRHFCEEVGAMPEYEAGTLDAYALIGRSGRVMIDIEPAKGQYRAKNKVDDYGDRGSDPKPVSKAAREPYDPGMSDESIPF